MSEPLEGLILIVDDDPEHQRLLVRALRRLGVQNRVCCLNDGEQMMAYFKGHSPYCDRAKYALPGILFLRLDLRALNGPPMLDWLHGSGVKTNARLFVYGERRTANELERIRNLGADLFVKQPVQEIDLLDLIYRFPEAWAIKVPEKSNDSVLPSLPLTSARSRSQPGS